MITPQGTSYFLDGGYVQIIDPDPERRLKAVELTKRIELETRTQERFVPIRLVANFILVTDQDPSAILEKFDPPITLKVRYTRGDWQCAGEQLALAKWYQGYWIRFTPDKHNFRLEPDDPDHKELGGYGVVEISDWGDPHIAWGT